MTVTEKIANNVSRRPREIRVFSNRTRPVCSRTVPLSALTVRTVRVGRERAQHASTPGQAPTFSQGPDAAFFNR